MIKNKRAQFYLLAALLIILIILGFAAVSNSARKEGIDKSELYELFADTNIDKQQLIDYNIPGGTGYTLTEINEILGHFTNTYSSIEKIYFIIKDGEEKYYEYEPGRDLTDLGDENPMSGYILYLSENSYAMIIIESNGEQFVVWG